MFTDFPGNFVWSRRLIRFETSKSCVQVIQSREEKGREEAQVSLHLSATTYWRDSLQTWRRAEKRKLICPGYYRDQLSWGGIPLEFAGRESTAEQCCP